MSNTWHHSKKAERFNPRARTRWRVRSWWSAYFEERHTYVNIMTPPAWYRRMQNRLWRRKTARETARYEEIRTTRPRSAWEYW